MAELKGKVQLIGPLESVGASNYLKQMIVVGYTKSWGGQNPGSKDIIVPVTFGGKTTEKLNSLAVGQDVTIQYDLEGREWRNKYFVDVKGYDLKIESSAPSNLDRPSTQNASAPVQQPVAQDDSDGLPF